MFDWVLNALWFIRRTMQNGATIPLFCNIYVIASASFVLENENITLKNTWLLISQD